MTFTPAQQQQLNALLLSVVDSEKQQTLQSFVSDHPHLLPALLKNFEKKKQIFQSGNVKALQELLEEERNMIISA